MNNCKHEEECNSAYVIGYIQLRMIVGILGISLPFILIISNSLYHGITTEVLRSISSYYYSSVQHIYGGIIFTIAIFLFVYKYDDNKEFVSDCPKYLSYINIKDDTAGNIACVFAILLVLFPTAENTESFNYISTLHFIFAAGFLIMLAYFSLCLFTRREPNCEKIWKSYRNYIYKTCGYLILFSIITIAIIKIFIFDNYPKIEKFLLYYDYVFWLESLALWTFGFSWLVKGGTILKDKESKV